MIKKSVLRFVIILFSIILLIVTVNITLRQPVHSLDLPGSFRSLDHNLKSENWQGAIVSVEELKDKWTRARFRITLNAGIDSLRVFEEALARLEEAVNHEDPLQAQLELAGMQVLWREFITF